MNKMISVVIPAYNEEDIIGNALEGLALQKTTYPYEVIVVDNASTDKTSTVAKSYGKRMNIRVVHEKRKGRGAARARGFAEAKGDVIFSTDADSIVPPNWIEDTMKILQDKDIIAVTGSPYLNDCKPWTNASFNLLFPPGMYGWRLTTGHYLICGFNFAVRKDAYRQSGGFNPSLNAGEDVDISFKLAKVGKIAWGSPKVWFSGRRFQKGLLRGVFPYAGLMRDYLFRRDKAYLPDIRN